MSLFVTGVSCIPVQWCVELPLQYWSDWNGICYIWGMSSYTHELVAAIIHCCKVCTSLPHHPPTHVHTVNLFLGGNAKLWWILRVWSIVHRYWSDKHFKLIVTVYTTYCFFNTAITVTCTMKALKCKPWAQYIHVVSKQCSILWRSMSMSIHNSWLRGGWVLFATVMLTVGAACSWVVNIIT